MDRIVHGPLAWERLATTPAGDELEPTFTTLTAHGEAMLMHRLVCPCGSGWHLVVPDPLWTHCSSLSDPLDLGGAMRWAALVLAACGTPMSTPETDISVPRQAGAPVPLTPLAA